MKAGKKRRVPFSEVSASKSEAVQKVREGDYVFPGGKAGRPLSNMAFLMLLRRMGRGDLTAHGFRSTFSDWRSERTNFAADLREMALAHTVSDKIEAAYQEDLLLVPPPAFPQHANMLLIESFNWAILPNNYRPLEECRP
jgi:integrase